MIDRIQIQNFQSHKATDIKLDPGVNVIVGSTDSGKTAIIRALKWLIWNRPSGDSFRSTWGGATKVAIDLNGIEVARTKFKENFYYADGVEFTAFGADVPFEVKHALNMGEINLQNQLDAPFLLTKSPGEVAKHFNEIAHLDQIDISLKNINRWINEHNQFIKSEGARIEKLEKDLEEFAYIDKLDILLEVLEEQDKQFIQITNSKDALEKHVDVINNVDETLENLKEDIVIGDTIDAVLEVMEELDTVNIRVSALKSLLDTIETVDITLEEKMEYIAIEADVNVIFELIQSQDDIYGDQIYFQMLLDRLNNVDNLLITAQKDYDKLHTKFHIELPDVCPLCNQKVKK